jgi:hypothetical protein
MAPSIDPRKTLRALHCRRGLPAGQAAFYADGMVLHIIASIIRIPHGKAG